MRIIRVRAFDVATFVAHGAAQVGIVGSDVVEEFAYSDLYAPVDLDIGHCRLSVAEPCRAGSGLHQRQPPARREQVSEPHPPPLREAGHPGRSGEAERRDGARPGLGLASRIVDLVSTGKTLKDNGLAETA
jgi:ATP phosphoribosyltransferase